MYYLFDFIHWKHFHVMQSEIFPTITFCIAVQELEVWVPMYCSKFEEGDSQAQLYQSFWSSQEVNRVKRKASISQRYAYLQSWPTPHARHKSLYHSSASWVILQTTPLPLYKLSVWEKSTMNDHHMFDTLHWFGWPNKYLMSFCLLLPNL